jgi:transposase
MTATILSGPERRRRWSAADKLRIVEEGLQADASIADVARRHGIHPNQLHNWRREAGIGPLRAASARATASDTTSRLIPVTVRSSNKPTNPAGKELTRDPSLVEVLLRNGRLLRLSSATPAARAAELADALEGLGR